MILDFKHHFIPKLSFDGGSLDCGSGLLLKIRKHIDQLEQGELLEVLSTENSVEEDLPAWCRLTNNELVSLKKINNQRSFLISKGAFGHISKQDRIDDLGIKPNPAKLSADQKKLESINLAIKEIPGCAVMGIGSWPRPTWLIKTLHLYLEGKVPEEVFSGLCDEAIRECVNFQIEAGADVVTDGELRRDNYSSFIANKLNNCQLIPLIDLLPLVDDPEKFSQEMSQLDVPAETVRHPAVFGKISRASPLSVNEALFLKSITDKPIKISLPGPYLLTRTMWMECIPSDAYQKREDLAEDIISILRQELADLISSGVELIQFDEPVLTEVVFHPVSKNRTFMCGALSQKKSTQEELEFASYLIEKVIKGFDPKRIGLHVCRGNWTKDESKALQGPYTHLLSYFEKISVGTLFLEYATKRAGDFTFLKNIKDRFNLGVGFVNQKLDMHEDFDLLVNNYKELKKVLGDDYKGSLYLTPDCGFATFADSPICSAVSAKDKILLLTRLRDYANRTSE